MRVFVLVAVVSGLACQQGSKGDTGPQGAKGDTGPTGVAGSQGPQGTTGERGAQGDLGASGPPGRVVVISAVDGGELVVDGGLVIAAGPVGPQGPVGPTGSTGASGPSGPPGATGPAGGAGPAGRDGDQFGETAASFAGFTSTAFSGSIGGREAANLTCATDFAGSHLCHLAEFHLANPAVDVPDGGVWVDPSATATPLTRVVYAQSMNIISPDSSRALAPACAHWTDGSVTSGVAVFPSGPALSLCNQPRPLACCNTPFRERVVGFTNATTTGGQRGTTSMHLLCAAELPGSHFCRASEYVRATPTTPPPLGGAWLDTDGLLVENNFGLVVPNVVSPEGFKSSGRVVGALSGSTNCDSWTSGAASASGYVAAPATFIQSGLCSVPHRVACCR